MNKKGRLGEGGVDIFPIIMGILLFIGIAGMMTLYVFSHLTFEDVAEGKCEELGLELFDYSSGSAFTQSSITCINRTTKETVKIR